MTLEPDTLPFTLAPEPEPPPPATPTDPYTSRLTTLIEFGFADDPRSRQVEIGASEVGFPCPRRLVYRHLGVRPVNVVDPGRMLVGSGIHAALATIFTRLNAGARRFLIEHPVNFRGVLGTLDLYDIGARVVVDWKSTTRATLAKYRSDGPPLEYHVQLQIYGAGLAAQGYPVEMLALAFLPVDGALANMWVWCVKPDVAVANDAVDRFQSLHIYTPSEMKPVPGRYCGSCPYYTPTAINLDHACPGI